MNNYRYIIRASLAALVLGTMAFVLGPAGIALGADVEKLEDGQVTAPWDLGHLDPFFRALLDLETGRRKEPVLILFLGDSHMAGGVFSSRLRTLFQERFGDAGRGSMPPGKPFKYYHPDRVTVHQSSDWKVDNSFETPRGLYGLSGFRLSSGGKAELMLDSGEGRTFDRFSLDYIGRPDGGNVTIRTDTKVQVTVSTKEAFTRPRRLMVESPRAARSLKLALGGDGPVDLIAWGVEQHQPGVILESHGIIGATAAVTRVWDPEIVAWELARRRPSLVVLEYGGNEGFNDALDLDEYRDMFRRQCAWFKKWAPDAALLLLGPSDCARWPSYCTKKGYQDRQGQCRSLTEQETALYAVLKRKEDPSLCRWHPPPRLEKVRQIQRETALDDGYLFWDWQRLMRRECGIQEWVDQDPPLAAGDHVHLTNRGYTISANTLFRDLMEYYVYYCTRNADRK